MNAPENYEQMGRAGQFKGWVLLMLLSVLILGYAVWAMLSIPDVPRHFDYGQLEDTPGASIYSTQNPRLYTPTPEQAGATQLQVVPLPEAKPLEVLPARGFQQQGFIGIWAGEKP